MMEFHYSALNTYAMCPRQAYYRYRKLIQPAQTPIALMIGTDIHEILATLYSPSIDDNICAWDMITECLNEILKKYPDSDETVKIGWSEFTRADIREMLTDITYRSTIRFIQISNKYEVVAVEWPFTFQRFGKNYGGTIDLILKDRETGDIAILDWKSMSKSLPENYLELNMQKFMYAMGYYMNTGIMPKKFIVGGILKRKISRPELLKNGKLSTSEITLKNTTLELFRDAIIDNDLNLDDYDDIITYLYNRDTSPEEIDRLFPLQEIELTDELMARGWGNIEARALLYEFSANNDIWPKCDGMACIMCKNSYRALCLAEEKGENIEEVLQDLYVVREPNDRALDWGL
jgi:hypothetical protein